MSAVSVFDLSGQVALVTGAGRGIGAAIAKALANSGVHVVLNDIDVDAARTVTESILFKSLSASFLHADICDEKEVASLFHDAFNWKQRLDIVVCNAGSTSSSDIFSVSLADGEKILRVNLTGTFMRTRSHETNATAEFGREHYPSWLRGCTSGGSSGACCLCRQQRWYPFHGAHAGSYLSSLPNQSQRPCSWTHRHGTTS